MPVDLSRIANVELGVGIGRGDELKLWSVPIDEGVGTALVEMTAQTIATMASFDEGPEPFNPANKQAPIEYLTVRNTEEDCPVAFRCFKTGTLDPLPDIKDNMRQMRFYFARIIDRDGTRSLGVKSSAFFKRIGSRHRVITYFENSLKLYDDPIFQLDNEFDFLIDADTVHILKPRQFVIVCEITDALKVAAPENVSTLNRYMPMFDLSPIIGVAQQRSQVASLVASILELNYLKRLNVEKLRGRCNQAGVKFCEQEGRLVVQDDQVIRFLQVLDIRSYSADLTDDDPEEWIASSRSRAR